MEPTPVTISLDLANQLLGYLGKRPYEEVFTIINEFQRQYKENADLAKGVQFPTREKLEAEEVDGTT
jgi:hypothetical protein